MRRCAGGLAGLALATGLAAIVSTAGAAPPDGGQRVSRQPVADDVPNPVEEKRRELRKAALQKVLNGKLEVQRRNGSQVVKVGEARKPGNGPAVDQYVELAREKTDRIFVILAEFGNQRDPAYPDQDTDPATPGPTRFDGPLHNEIPAPDRTRDNTTVWQADYSPEHYRRLYFGEGSGVESLKTYYERQSSGRYSVEGQVSDWVKVPYNEARYGRSNGFPCPLIVCSNSEDLITDGLNAWIADQHAKGRTDAQIAEDVKSYDQWDRNDYDNDGNFNEPDGYIDHFQIVHAGGDQADGDPFQGEDAIWSHRGKAFDEDRVGPPQNQDGGVQIGNTGVWVADYTMQPENGGVSVFAHEYAHDLGLPDEYDTAAPGDNGVEWWSLMAQSRASAPQDQGIGTRAADLGAWDKLQLGWLDYEVTVAGQTKTLDLGPHEYNSAKAQGAVVVLPKKSVTTQFGAPFAGEKQWWSQAGDDLDNSMSREVTLPAGAGAELTFQARWNIEDCGPDACDYAYVEVDDGAGYQPIAGSITNPAEGNGIDGDRDEWTPATFDLSAYAGKTIKLRFHYRTDGAAQGTDPNRISGLFADDVKVTSGGTTVFEDGAEDGADGWTLDGFRDVGESETIDYDNYYVVSNRQYVSYDQYLKSGPYNFGFPDKPDWVEHFPYQDGLIVSYWDTSFSNNNTSQHPGQGEILVVDSHPERIYNLDGLPWRGRIQVYDAPFSLEKADSFTLHAPSGRASYIRGQAAQPLFDDRREYWSQVLPRVGVKVPHAGVQIRVLTQNGTSMRIRVQPAPGAAARD
jgi:immune inhibitor A